VVHVPADQAGYCRGVLELMRLEDPVVGRVRVGAVEKDAQAGRAAHGEIGSAVFVEVRHRGRRADEVEGKPGRLRHIGERGIAPVAHQAQALLAVEHDIARAVPVDIGRREEARRSETRQQRALGDQAPVHRAWLRLGARCLLNRAQLGVGAALERVGFRLGRVLVVGRQPRELLRAFLAVQPLQAGGPAPIGDPELGLGHEVLAALDHAVVGVESGLPVGLSVLVEQFGVLDQRRGIAVVGRRQRPQQVARGLEERFGIVRVRGQPLPGPSQIECDRIVVRSQCAGALQPLHGGLEQEHVVARLAEDVVLGLDRVVNFRQVDQRHVEQPRRILAVRAAEGRQLHASAPVVGVRFVAIEGECAGVGGAYIAARARVRARTQPRGQYDDNRANREAEQKDQKTVHGGNSRVRYLARYRLPNRTN